MNYDWTVEVARNVINSNPDIKRWGVVMDVGPFAAALRTAFRHGYDHALTRK